jgi:membrane-associated phospholipid phosphatase
MGLLLVVTLWGFALLLFLSPFGSQPQAMDQAVLAGAQSLRNHIADPAMVAVSQLSRWWVLGPTAVATLLWLLGAQRFTAAIHWLVAMAGGLLLQLLLSWGLRSTPMIHATDSEQFYAPSADMTMATVVLLFFCVIVAKELRRRSRKWPYLGSALLITLLFASRIYLGLDWLSGAMVGAVLGLAWTAIVGIAYRQRAQRKFSGAIACLIFFGTLVLAFSWQVEERVEEDLAALRLPLPEQSLELQEWWTGGWARLPAERTHWQSVQARRFNLQVLVPPEAFQEALEDSGWALAEPPGIGWLLQALNPTPTESTLPPFGKDFLGYPEVLVMRYPTDDPDRQQVLRLWDSGARIQPGNQPLYLGLFSEEQLVQRFRVFSYWRASVVNSEELMATSSPQDRFEIRRAEDSLLLIRPPALPASLE